jgi:hypothetical protein
LLAIWRVSQVRRITSPTTVLVLENIPHAGAVNFNGRNAASLIDTLYEGAWQCASAAAGMLQRPEGEGVFSSSRAQPAGCTKMQGEGWKQVSICGRQRFSQPGCSQDWTA